MLQNILYSFLRQAKKILVISFNTSKHVVKITGKELGKQVAEYDGKQQNHIYLTKASKAILDENIAKLLKAPVEDEAQKSTNVKKLRSTVLVVEKPKASEDAFSPPISPFQEKPKLYNMEATIDNIEKAIFKERKVREENKKETIEFIEKFLVKPNDPASASIDYVKNKIDNEILKSHVKTEKKELIK